MVEECVCYINLHIHKHRHIAIPSVPFSKDWLDRASGKGTDEETSWSKASFIKLGSVLEIPWGCPEVLTRMKH